MVKKYILLKLICIVVLVTIAPFVAIAQVDPGIDPDLGFSYISPRFLTQCSRFAFKFEKLAF